MAHYHLDVNVGTKSEDGKLAASSHYAYICREGLFAKLKSDEELVLTGSGNMPAWAAIDPSVFWLASDTYERANGSVYREIEGALPREVPREAQQAIVQKFIDRVLAQHPYSWGIHVKKASDGEDQPHVHLMWSERVLDGIERSPELFFKRAAAARVRKDGTRGEVDASKGGCKKDSMHERLEEFRALWAELVNGAYAEAGLDLRVDHRSYAERGIDKVPERHQGPVRAKALAEARAEADQAEREAELMVALATRTLVHRKPAPPMPPTFDDLPPVPPRFPVSYNDLRPNPRPAPNSGTEQKFMPVVRPEDRCDPGPVQAPKLPRRPVAAPSEDQQFAAFLSRLTAPAPRQAPRKSGERRQRPRIYQSASSSPSRWREYRLRILVRAYGTGSTLLADAWFIEQSALGIVMSRTDGSRVVDRGSRIEAEHGSLAEVKAAIELAKLKGWSEVKITGADEFKRLAMAEALRAGLKVDVDNIHDKRLLDRVKTDLGAP